MVPHEDTRRRKLTVCTLSTMWRTCWAVSREASERPPVICIHQTSLHSRTIVGQQCVWSTWDLLKSTMSSCVIGKGCCTYTVQHFITVADETHCRVSSKFNCVAQSYILFLISTVSHTVRVNITLFDYISSAVIYFWSALIYPEILWSKIMIPIDRPASENAFHHIHTRCYTSIINHGNVSLPCIFSCIMITNINELHIVKHCVILDTKGFKPS